ncbi:MAG TPA: nitrilase-related carbon-nitrogen hydrolase [Thermoanaerobaculia bacterium]|jgi:predicted amidohydrolase
MRIAALQSDVVWEDPDANFARLEPWIAAAAAAGARLLALPEMYACGFSMATERIREPPDGPSTRFLVDQAARHGLWLAGSLPERAEGAARPHNTLVLAGPGGELHRYHKIHPFSYAGEDEHYAAGTDFLTVEVEGLRLTAFICYDLRFADEFWATAEATDVYLVVANWPETRRHHWQTLLLARAIENQAYVVGVNRVGSGGSLRYAGDSRVIDPRGEILAAAAEQETLLLAELDAAVVAETRRALPFLRDRR